MEAHSGQARGSSLSCFMASSHDPAGFPSHCAPLPQPIPFLGALLKLFWTLRSHAELAQCQDTVPLHSPFTIGQCGLRVLLDRQHLVMENSVTWRRGGQAVILRAPTPACTQSASSSLASTVKASFPGQTGLCLGPALDSQAWQTPLARARVPALTLQTF